MPQEIVARFRWTMEEVTEAARLHDRQARRRWVFVFCLVMAILTGAWAVSSYLHDGDWDHVWWGFAACLYFLILVGGIRFVALWRTRRSFAKGTGRDTEILWQITDTVLRVKTVHGLSEVNWSAFNKAVLAPKGLLLYSQPLVFHWLPRHAFESDAGFETVSEMARHHVLTVRELK